MPASIRKILSCTASSLVDMQGKKAGVAFGKAQDLRYHQGTAGSTVKLYDPPQTILSCYTGHGLRLSGWNHHFDHLLAILCGRHQNGNSNP